MRFARCLIWKFETSFIARAVRTYGSVNSYSVLPRISQRSGGVGVAKWNALVGVVVSNVGVVI